MKNINQFIIEKFKINKDNVNFLNKYEIASTNKNEGKIEFEPSKKNKRFNPCFEWLCKHCQIEPNAFKDQNTEFKVDKVLFNTNKYELKSVLCYIYPKDKELNQSSKIRGEYKRLSEKYENGLKEDEIFGILVSPQEYNKSRNAYGELIFTNKGIYWNYIDDYALKISDETLV